MLANQRQNNLDAEKGDHNTVDAKNGTTTVNVDCQRQKGA
jgi:hypothetical protein